MTLLVNKNGDAIQVDHDGKLIVEPMITNDELKELEAAREVVETVKAMSIKTHSSMCEHILSSSLPCDCGAKDLYNALEKYDEVVK